ncbi:MAG: crossover junction endodeoxyribonuclease RuvC [Patescibacteria group bacterium]
MPKTSPQEKILGIDPGLATTGYGLINISGNKILLGKAGIIKTAVGLPIEKRLEIIFRELNKLIKKHKPRVVAVEQLFFSRNVKTAMSVGMARGVILLACSTNNVALKEYTPLQVKQAITGYGQATKKQIQLMVKSRLKLKQLPRPDDLADALAIAICCFQTKKWK